MSRTAVVLFNLGGPDSPRSVQPFLFNLFNDPAIIGAPQPIRWLLAKLISTRRAPVAQQIYAQLGGRSPLLPQTLAQAAALEEQLQDLDPVKVFVSMRYWRPFARDVAQEVKAWRPDRVVLLPLYPQYSTTTTGSSLKQWGEVARDVGLAAPAHTLCCWPQDAGFAAAQAELIDVAVGRFIAPPRILFSAHGLPKRVIAAGDPYQWQVERTVDEVLTRLGGRHRDHAVCYQSRVGPLEWIGPSTEAELERAGRDGVGVVMVPIAFVSEHSETLVELDIEYREKAEELGVPQYERVPAVTVRPAFIAGLADLVRRALRRPGAASATGARLCPAAFGKCPMGS